MLRSRLRAARGTATGTTRQAQTVQSQEVTVDRSLIRRMARGASLAVVVAAGVALSGGDMLAATPVAHHGPQGHYSFTDTAGSPGATCKYGHSAGHHEFNSIRVNGPSVNWLTTSAFNSGAVRLTIRLQHWDGSAWSTVAHTSESQVFASKAHAQTFPAKTVHWNGVSPHTYRFRAEAFIRWVTPDATTIGSVTVLLDHYTWGFDGSVHSSCQARVVNPI